MAIDPEGIVDTLRELARLDPVELGLQAVLDQIVQAATTCCGVTGGVGLLLLGPDDQLHYVAVADRRRSLLGGTNLPDDEGPSVEAFVQDEPVSNGDLGAEGRWPAFRQLVIAAGIRAWLSVPVRQRHGPIGALDFARTDPQPWQPQDLATSSAFARLIMATLELAAARQHEGLTPSCSSPCSMTPASNRPVASSWNASGSTRTRRPRCCTSRPRSRIGQSEPSPSASSPVSDADPLRSLPTSPEGKGADWLLTVSHSMRHTQVHYTTTPLGTRISRPHMPRHNT
jgi:hypothetical protein